MKCRCESSQGIDSCHLRHGTASRTSIFGDCPHLHPGAAGALFTGKPEVEGLGYAFLFRNYRAGLGKWQTADPLGYPDGWNQMAYGNNAVINGVDRLGGTFWDDLSEFVDAFNAYVRFLQASMSGPTNPNPGWNIVESFRPVMRTSYNVEVRFSVSWQNIQSTISGVTTIVQETGDIWFNGDADHVMGLASQDESYSNFMQACWSDQSPFWNFVEDYIPNMHETSIVHDAWVDYLVNEKGWNMSLINVPTMVPAYLTALMINLWNTGDTLSDVLIRKYAE